MKQQPLVSIIIPTFNRANLIGETLDSVLAQTYTNWECIIVDDGSTDNTDDVIEVYVAKDARFKYFKRPEKTNKGANACRNIGLVNSYGDYIIFFDSDDLMTLNHIKHKIKPLVLLEKDFVISKTKYFNLETDRLDKYYAFNNYNLTAYNYIKQNINWLTFDVCIKADLAKSIQFHEKLKANQEFNYFSKLVHKSCNAIFIDEILSLRRHHDLSIRSSLNNQTRYYHRLLVNWITYKELALSADLETKKILIGNCINMIYNLKSIKLEDKSKFIFEILKLFKFKSVYFLFMILGLKIFGRGYYFKNLIVK